MRNPCLGLKYAQKGKAQYQFYLQKIKLIIKLHLELSISASYKNSIVFIHQKSVLRPADYVIKYYRVI